MMTIQTIKKRNGDIVDFDIAKIQSAIKKAFGAVRGVIDETFLKTMIEEVAQLLNQTYANADQTPTVESVQNIVEKVIMGQGYYDVAKAYIIYRYEHSQQRAEKKKEIIEKIDKNELTVIKRSGAKETFDIEKLKRSLSWAIKGYEHIVDIEALALQCKSELYDNISTEEIAKALIMNARSWIEQDPAYSFIAARLLLGEVYKKVIGYDVIDFSKLNDQYRSAFIINIKKGVEIGRIDPRMLTYDLEALSRYLKPERDELLMYLGLQTLYDRYLISDHETKNVLETPQAFWMRIAMGCALQEKTQKTEHAIQFYEIMSKLLYTPSTPTLFHAGTPRPQLSSCYLNTVSDSLENIFKTYADNSQLSKWSGGIGTDWTNIRGTGAFIEGTGVESQGVIPFLKIANDVTVAINRSGRRRGAACVYLEVWHYDFEDFAELRKNTGDERRRTHDMDTAAWIPDLFMKRVRDDADWTLLSPDEAPDLHHIYGRDFEKRYAKYEELAKQGKIALFKTVKARDIWKKIITMLFETGHPWVTFKDPSNVRSPQDHVGVIHNSNLCTEITLNTSEDETAVCNLGSLNFAKFVTNGKFDIELVRETVTTAMRMLDNVIDINFYPTIDAKRSNMRHRPVGLGIRGFQDALYLLDINFDSEQCVEFSDSSMEAVAYYAILGSAMLAKERGAYQSFKGSKWDRGIMPVDTLDLLERERGEMIDVARTTRLDWNFVRETIKEHGMRNSNCLAVAPTATTANIVGCVPTIEPIYKNIYVKSNQAGDFTVINPYLVEDLKKLNLWDFEMLGKIKYHDGSIAQIAEIPEALRNRYKEVFEIDPHWLIKSAAYRGKWIDQSQSLNIYFKGSSGKDLSEVYMYAWQLGLKTTYYLRTLAASQTEKSTVNTTQFGSTHNRTFNAVRYSKSPSQTVPPTSTDESIISEPMNSISYESAKFVSASTYPTAGNGLMPKLCAIEDPDCESCQA